ncbi:MAG TPA: hypothetical protein VJQ06_00165 [Rhizomicrobium sp.]|nr:hypothetical protein [Rhizomicrobium sp.]
MIAGKCVRTQGLRPTTMVPAVLCEKAQDPILTAMVLSSLDLLKTVVIALVLLVIGAAIFFTAALTSKTES